MIQSLLDAKNELMEVRCWVIIQGDGCQEARLDFPTFPLGVGGLPESVGRRGAEEEGRPAQELDGGRVAALPEEGGGARIQVGARGGREAPALVQPLPALRQCQGADHRSEDCQHTASCVFLFNGAFSHLSFIFTYGIICSIL